jgi:hypothetical protein
LLVPSPLLFFLLSSLTRFVSFPCNDFPLSRLHFFLLLLLSLFEQEPVVVPRLPGAVPLHGSVPWLLLP